MKIVPTVAWQISVFVLLVGAVISVAVSRSVVEKRMDGLLKQQQLSMEREARIWLEWMQAVESGETASLSWLYARGALAVRIYEKQAERNPWAENPVFQERARQHREYLKANPGLVGRGLKKLGAGPWLPEAAKSPEP